MSGKPRIRYVLGIDAGGTHTRCQVVDEHAKTFSFGLGGPANTNFVPFGCARDAVERALSTALETFEGTIDAAVIAGPHLPPEIRSIVARRTETRNIILTDEFEACLAAGLEKPCGWGMVVMSGTGSFCKGRNTAGKEKYVGGWGPMIGDEGSGHDLAKEALMAVARAYEGRGKETMLSGLILSSLGIYEIQGLKKLLYNPPIKRHRLAALAREVFAAAEAGDEVAVGILQDAGARLAQLAVPVLVELFGRNDSFPVVLGGGILCERSELTETLISKIEDVRPRANVFVSTLRPVTGTVIIALESLRVPIDSRVIANLREGALKMKNSG